MEVLDADESVVHVLDRPLEAGEYDCAIDWTRRFDHMQQHTGQHLLSAVLIEAFGMPTVSFHLGAEASTIDVATPSVSPAQMLEAEDRANALVFENRPVTVSYHDSSEDIGLRKASGRTGAIRVVTIADLDRSACGGTHVRSTAEIGPIRIGKLDKVRGNARIEFWCGLRAIARARSDYEGLLRQSAAQAERLAESEKIRRKLSAELAGIRGRELYASTAPNAKGLRVHVKRVALGPVEEEVRAEAQAFASLGAAAYLVACESPATLLLAVSEDSPSKAGPTLKPMLEKHGGRGGGSAALAQGSLPSAAALDALVRDLLALFA